MEELLAASRANDSGQKLEVNEKIIDSCTSLVQAIRLTSPLPSSRVRPLEWNLFAHNLRQRDLEIDLQDIAGLFH